MPKTRINELFFMRPWAVKEDVLSMMAMIAERHIKGEKLADDEIDARTGSANSKTSAGYEVVDGVAYVPVYGVIAKRSAMVNRISQPRGTSVEQIRQDIDAALGDAAVNTIVLDIDSPGGSVAGVAEIADYIFEARQQKRIVAFTDGVMASAAYWIGSSADKIYATKSAEVGSIGVYTVIRDTSVLEHNAGIRTEIIKAGRYKGAGHSSKPLTDDERGLIQSEINEYYDLFTDAIARNRGMALDDVLQIATGQIFIGKKAVESGLVDEIRTMESLNSGSGDIKTQNKGKQTKTSVKEVIMPDVKTVRELKAEYPAAVKEIEDEGVAAGKKAGIEEGYQKGVDAGVVKERARVTQILADASGYQGMQELACAGIKEGISVEEFRGRQLKELKTAAPQSPGPNAEQNLESGAGKPHIELAKEYQAAHKCSMTDALKATASRRS